MFERLAKNKREFEEQTKVHINEYADAGLRTLILAYRELDEEEYNEFNAKFTEAKNSVSADRDQRVEQVTEKIEKDLILLGATAVEDKLQNGVPECIDKLAQAGIKIMRRIEAEELSLGASEIVIISTRQEIEQQWRLYDGFDPILERKLQAKIKRNVSCYGRFMPRMALIPPGMEFHNIVPQDGDMDAETEGNEDHSSSPDPLIWTEICYFFYKNIAFGFTIFFFGVYAFFSGQSVYSDWFLSFYNVFEDSN